MRKGTPLASRGAQGVSGPLLSCVWYLRTYNAGDPSSIPGSGRSPWRRDRLPTPGFLGFPGVSDSKESTCNVEDLDLIPELGRFPGGGHGNPLQYSCLENRHGQRRLAGSIGSQSLTRMNQLPMGSPPSARSACPLPSLAFQSHKGNQQIPPPGLPAAPTAGL